ncbi:hypothetical protein [Acinetobacter oleivorans]|uniref:hypothetical protein n=1 Tax=Acinetobacter oleivorans TaxID=1148157 RepID=UPI001CD4D384|nr:hypothetical protein [Acinetobacter oleivorans]
MTIYKPILALSFILGSYDFFSLQSPVLLQDFAPTFFSIMQRCNKSSFGYAFGLAPLSLCCDGVLL